MSVLHHEKKEGQDLSPSLLPGGSSSPGRGGRKRGRRSGPGNLVDAMRDQYGDDAWVTELIADLSASSSEFRAWWPEHEILLTCNRSSEIYHPLVGHLAFQLTTLTVPQQADCAIVVYTPLPQSDTAAKLDALMRG